MKPSEAQKWAGITYHFMSEESSEEDHITRHSMPWRSNGEYKCVCDVITTRV